MSSWSKWIPFPDPRKNGYLYAPFGAGVYELRRRSTGRKVLFGKGGNLAFRMSSLLPKPYGCGVRKNKQKREYVLEYIEDIEYRTLPCSSIEEANFEEIKLKKNRDDYLFKESNDD